TVFGHLPTNRAERRTYRPDMAKECLIMDHNHLKNARTTILIQIARTHDASAASFERYLGPSILRRRVLHYLSAVATATQKEICQHVGLDGWAVTRAAKPLEQLGFIERSLASEDNRMTRVVITQRGRDWCAEAAKRRATFLHRALDGLSDDEIQVLENLLARIKSNILDDMADSPEPSSDQATAARN